MIAAMNVSNPDALRSLMEGFGETGSLQIEMGSGHVIDPDIVAGVGTEADRRGPLGGSRQKRKRDQIG